MCNAQRHSDGSTTIGWGGNFGSLKLSDLHPDGSKALGLGIQAPGHVWWTYRAFRFPWRTTRFVPEPDSLDFAVVQIGGSGVRALAVRNPTASAVTISCAATTDPAFAVTTALPVTVPAGGQVTVEVAFTPADPGEHDAVLYLRQVTNDELVAQAVAMRGLADGTTGVTGRDPSEPGLHVNRPNPFHRATTIAYTLARPGRVHVEIIDVHGRRVATLADGYRPAGTYEVTWAARNRASGIYFCRLTAGDLVATRKLVLTN